ncbi:MAG: diaminopimelate epimerase [Bacteroidetes bacterium RIFOXYA12_FULL_40_10]|nr:MAG: diaminopimelate epimerase [Bacteroidetes bacterium RIFOXYA12_FULL_40_10]HBG25372.1 diaminopimelate epimerase [Rikenellaceae bacterium]
MDSKKSQRLISKITDLIGNTPIIKIDKKLHGLNNVELYAKLEYLNPFGSLKDRTALGMLRDSLQEISSQGRRVIETSSGNTAKALQCICNVNGIEFTTVTNRIRVSESRNILRFIGTDVMEVSKDVDTVAMIEEMILRDPSAYFHTTQYSNRKNIEAHKVTGNEILEDIGKVDYFIHVLGTSGSGRGIAQRLSADNNQLKTVGVVTSAESYIPGIRSVTELGSCGFFNREEYDSIEEVSANTAKCYMKKLCRGMGILAGVSSGAAFAAAVSYLKREEEKHQASANIGEFSEEMTDRDLLDNTLKKAVIVVCDRLETYANFIKENRFYKYHVLGNTYIIVDAVDNSTPLSIEFVKRICHKEYGAGADGLIYGPLEPTDHLEQAGHLVSTGHLNPGQVYEYKAYNKDGSEVKSALFASMIFAKYLKDKEVVKSDSIPVQIAEQKMSVEFLNREATRIKVTIKEPVIKGVRKIGGLEYINVYLGNENLVREEQNPTKEMITERGEEIHASGEFPDGVNIQLVNIISRNHIQIETFERGVGYTLASGTSVMASCFAMKGRLGTSVSVHTPGGICKVDLNSYSITAEVFKIFEGEFEL